MVEDYDGTVLSFCELPFLLPVPGRQATNKHSSSSSFTRLIFQKLSCWPRHHYCNKDTKNTQANQPKYTTVSFFFFFFFFRLHFFLAFCLYFFFLSFCLSVCLSVFFFFASFFLLVTRNSNFGSTNSPDSQTEARNYLSLLSSSGLLLLVSERSRRVLILQRSLEAAR